MKKPEQSIWWLIGGCVVLLSGILWSLSNIQRHPAQRRYIERKQADLQQMAALHESLQRQLDTVRAFDDLPSSRPPDWSSLLRDHAPDFPAEVRRRDTRDAWGPWQAHRMEVAFEHIALDALGQLMSAAEQQRPPWRLVEGNIRAANQRPGMARATLVFEGLSK